MTQSASAVFLSYASEDADAAARIAEGLRAAGIEVWFDKSELRVGDAWDRQIRQQIHDCRLFMPIICANSERRDAGCVCRTDPCAAVGRIRLPTTGAGSTTRRGRCHRYSECARAIANDETLAVNRKAARAK
jgi:hypothetical protein